MSPRETIDAPEQMQADRAHREVKARRPDLPVFMISAYDDNDTIATALERGANKFPTKPVDFLQLKLDVAAVITRAQGAQLPDPTAMHTFRRRRL